MANIVYVLTNEAMPGLVKIGCTRGDSVEDRIRQLNGATGVPLPFECHYAVETESDCVKLERTLHQLFADERVNERREFFRVDPEKVVLALSIGGFADVTPGADVVETQEDEAALEKARTRRSGFDMEAVGVPVGATLVSTRDEETTCTVLEGGRVEFQGENLSLSAAALRVLQCTTRAGWRLHARPVRRIPDAGSWCLSGSRA
jgi:hypothetical protein